VEKWCILEKKKIKFFLCVYISLKIDYIPDLGKSLYQKYHEYEFVFFLK
jgi:hypothetical protein